MGPGYTAGCRVLHTVCSSGNAAASSLLLYGAAHGRCDDGFIDIIVITHLHCAVCPLVSEGIVLASDDDRIGCRLCRCLFRCGKWRRFHASHLVRDWMDADLHAGIFRVCHSHEKADRAHRTACSNGLLYDAGVYCGIPGIDLERTAC